ncbi:MAG: V-type ATP synthase subunit I [Ruminococcus sp.]|jgi:V/A-type H+-transporting ATPase subunit I
MAVLKMQRITVCALKKNRKAILERLQALGRVEIDISLPQEEEDGLIKMDTAGARASFLKYTQAAERGLEILQSYWPEKQSLFSSLEGKPLVEKAEYESVIQAKDDLLANIKKLTELDKEISENTGKMQKLEVQMESLIPWMPLSVPMNYQGTMQTAMMIGTVPGAQSQEDIYRTFVENAPEVEAVDMEIISADKDYTYLAVLCMKSDKVRVENALRSIGFAAPSQMPAKRPEEIREELLREQKRLCQANRELEQKIGEFRKEKASYRLLADYFRIRAEKYEILGKLPQTEHVFFVSGYIPEKYASAVEKDLVSRYEAMVEIEEPSEEEEMPVLLENNSFAASVEGVLSAFGLPGKDDVDPSMIMAVCYVFLFGLMLSDAAYGLLVSIVCGVLLYRFPRMGDSMRKSLQLFFWCGLSTLFWGIMFGGYFGDLVDVVSGTFFGREVSIPAAWFVPLNEPMKMLVFSMLFGVIHLFLGLGIKGYICLKDRKYMDFICDVALWFSLLIGLILILLPTSLFASISQITFVFPGWLNQLAKILAIIGAIGILLMSGRSSKNPGIRIALGAYDLYNITGWVSDVLSYSRLLALGLATGVIASVVNQMGSMLGGGIAGAILFIVVFLIGHTFNIGINLLGAYVHTCRLQYVEFFGKFYEGGGRAFHPFKENTKYVDIKEENIL